MIVSLHLADIGPRRALRFQRTRLDAGVLEGLRYAESTSLAPLGAGLLPSPRPGRVGLIAAWDSEAALDGFLAGHKIARELAGGWRVRLQPMRISGSWPELPGIASEERAMEDSEPVAVLTLGRLRLTQTMRFLRASAAAEALALQSPALVTSTGLARPPRLVATFSLWSSTAAMRDYASGRPDPAHTAAVRAHAAKAFHHHSAFLRLRPYGAEGRWQGEEPLAAALAGASR
jgi:hypothetical protein